MSGPNFTGAAIFSGVGQGVDKAVDNIIKLKQMQEMDHYHKYRLALQGANDFYARGGHRTALNDGEGNASSTSKPEMEFDPEAVEAAHPTMPSALALGGE